MRNVPFTQSHWFFDANNNLQGLRTGSDFCTEHEIGIASILDAFGVDRDMESVERFRIRALPERLLSIEHDGVFAIMYSPYQGETYLMRKIDQSSRYLTEGDPVIAWNDKGFMLMAPLTNTGYATALKSLWDAFQRHDVYLGGPFGDKYGGGGMGFFIGSQMPQDAVKAASDEIAERAEKDRQLEVATQREGFAEVEKTLSTQGKRWFCLRPQCVNEDGSAQYWLNPWDRKRDYFGAVSIQDLKDWTQDTGKIPGGAKR